MVPQNEDEQVGIPNKESGLKTLKRRPETREEMMNSVNFGGKASPG